MDIKKLAKRAYIDISNEEAEDFLKTINPIKEWMIDYFAKISLDDVTKQNYRSVSDVLVHCSDAAQLGVTKTETCMVAREDILKNARSSQGFFVVPKFIKR